MRHDALARDLSQGPMPIEDGFALPDGSSVRRHGDSAEIRDPAGRVIVRYHDGSATISVPDGDLTLDAPRGSVRLRSGADVSIEAAGELRQRAHRLDIEARITRAALGTADVVARNLTTSATQLKTKVETYELEATRIVERARDLFRDVSDFAQLRAGRLSTIVRDVYNVDTRRTNMRSTDDTSIDGKRIRLG